MADAPPDNAKPVRQLSLFDTTSIIVGIIIGSGVYVIPPLVAGNVGSAGEFLGVWAAGGAFALLGALCYAELATAYPAEGGEFVYLSEAFGRGAGFLFAWVQLWVVRPGSIGFMAFVFAQYASQLVPTGNLGFAVYAITAVVGLACLNILGVKQGKWTQNVLTVAKVVGLVLVCAAGFIASRAPLADVIPSSGSSGSLGLALVLVMFTYGGWNDMVSVAAEVREPSKNLLRALVLGTLAVMAIYLAINGAFLHALGLAGVRGSQAVAADTVQGLLGDAGAKAVSALICISALGAMTGMTFTGSRIYYALGRKHRRFAWLGKWNPRLGTPVASIAAEAGITLAMIAVLASHHGTETNVFERLANFTAPLMWLVLGCTTLGLIVLRFRHAERPRPFRVPLYPVVPLVFLAVCGYMAYSSIAYAWANQSWEALWPIAVLIVGTVLALLESRTAHE